MAQRASAVMAIRAACCWALFVATTTSVHFLRSSSESPAFAGLSAGRSAGAPGYLRAISKEAQTSVASSAVADSDAKMLATLLSSAAAKMLENENELASIQARIAQMESELRNAEAVKSGQQAQLTAVTQEKVKAEAQAAALDKGIKVLQESAQLHLHKIQEIKQLYVDGQYDRIQQGLPVAPSRSGGAGSITEAEVRSTLNEWGNSIVEIGQVMRGYGDYTSKAADVIRRLYAYDLYPVLFKPTKASKEPFRPTFEGALSYFVGGNAKFPEDHGFAITPWTKVRIEPETFSLNKDTATVMGNYWFTNLEGKEAKVEFTFGYKKDSQGRLRVILHHSSLPFSG